ncbi:MAG TPA: type II secretion system F family protein [Bryobacteraceae bacterium]|jgi:tight adherence protein C|nr:type II secretion system F family protein [Bryobacteraceae bacterium]
MTLLLCSILFLVLVASISAFGYFLYARPTRMLEQLEKFSSDRVGSAADSKTEKPSRVAELLAKLGSLLPASPVEAALRKRELVMAGFRADSGVAAFAGLKIVLTAVLLAVGFALHRLPPNPALQILLPFGFAGIGYKLPDFALARLITKRQQKIRLGLADALDMLVVCCEAGSGLDQAILNVSREFKMVHPAISGEFATLNMELLAGSSRVTALRNLASRTGEEELRKLVAILIQTDRFGTSVADALRTQADFMRIRRRQAAEEKAGKVGVKLVFPIFFFCMPSLAILVIGPGLLQLMKNFLPALNGMK